VHAGCIVYVNSAVADQESLEKLKNIDRHPARRGI
jgi:hypothetical protein